MMKKYLWANINDLLSFENNNNYMIVYIIL